MSGWSQAIESWGGGQIGRKSLICLEANDPFNDLLLRKYFLTLEGHFELTQCPSRALNSPSVLLVKLQRIKNSVRGVELGAEVPGHCQEQSTQTLIVRL